MRHVPGSLRVAVVPGLAVRRYLLPALDELSRRGVEVDLLPSPGGTAGHRSPGALGAMVGSATRTRELDVVVGHSVGAASAVAAALTGEGVRAVVLVSPTPADSWLGLGLGWLKAGTRETVPFLLQQAGEWLRTSPAEVIGTLRSARRIEVDGVLDRLSCPVHVIRGERDPLATEDVGRRLVRGGGRLHTVPGASHSWPYADPDGFASRIFDVAENLPD